MLGCWIPREDRYPGVSQHNSRWDIGTDHPTPSTYDHRRRRNVGPVRSRIHKPSVGGLVLRWVTTGEYPLLYVLLFGCPSV